MNSAARERGADSASNAGLDWHVSAASITIGAADGSALTKLIICDKGEDQNGFLRKIGDIEVTALESHVDRNSLIFFHFNAQEDIVVVWQAPIFERALYAVTRR
jgi:hypothetical protein